MIKTNPYLSSRNGQLFIEECNVSELAKEFGTPVFLVSEALLRENFRKIKTSFEKFWPEGEVAIMTALKSNPNLAIRRILNSEGAGCDIYGPGELYCAMQAGTPAELVSVNGSIKDESIIEKAIDFGARIVIDAIDELAIIKKVCARLNKQARIMLRLKPYMPSISEEPSDFYPSLTITDLTQRIKYGLPNSDIAPILDILKDSPEMNLIGVHIHMGRHTKKLDVWKTLVGQYVEMIHMISTELNGWLPKHVDFGGGIASERDNEILVDVTDYETPSFEGYAQAITSQFRDSMNHYGLETKGITIEVEPGRALHNETGIHITTVRNIKRETMYQPNIWVELDTAETFLNLHGGSDQQRFPLVVANKLEQPTTMKADVVGQTCNAEMLFLDQQLPEMEKGDVMALLSTGSYIEPMTTNFNALPRPGMVLVHGDQAHWIKKHESIEQVFSRDVIPEHLK
ncbi:hypothetical protein [Paraferrimonas sp. SM1919]|uniref:diaminopimelate decarboxylase family protein n=1 Tax=Paraferrimonas sp. SM1919 TaxID=2662263 RepID=UPI0013D1DBFD|nr:hypothetical protein [Paraferrimonas sp. SM1919]